MPCHWQLLLSYSFLYNRYPPKDLSCRPYEGGGKSFPSYIKCLRNMCLLSDRPLITGSYFSPRDFLQSSLSKTDIWRTIIAWAMCKREELEQDNDKLTLFEQKKRELNRRSRKQDYDDKLTLLERKKTSAMEIIFGYWHPPHHDTSSFLRAREELREMKREIEVLEQETQAFELETAPEQKTQALEMFLHWVRHGGKEALKRAEFVLDNNLKPTGTQEPTHIEQHIRVTQLLELMEQEYWHTAVTQHPTSPRGMSVSSGKEIFKTMREEIPQLIEMHQKFGLRNPALETKFSTTLDKILRLSSWTPSSTHNKRLHELLRNALLMLNDLGGSEEYHDYLHDFIKRHTAFCAFTLDNADLITTEDSETTAELCKNLRRLAQNLGKIASTKAEQYQKLYEDFIAHKEDLSHWLDSASPGQGKSLHFVFTRRFYI